jgi:hypothetical protein
MGAGWWGRRVSCSWTRLGLELELEAETGSAARYFWSAWAAGRVGQGNQVRSLVRAGVKYEVGDALPLRRENEEAVLPITIQMSRSSASDHEHVQTAR